MMKFGLSTYSLQQAIKSGKMDILGVVKWIADAGADHAEIVPLGLKLVNDLDLVDQIRELAESLHLELSNYAIGANFLCDDPHEFEQEIERVMREVDVARRLGICLMRHDVAWLPVEKTSIDQFQTHLAKMTDACARIADYARPYGITTSIENHGYFVQASDRVQQLIHAVNRPNFKTTVDVGNFMCVDEDPVVAVKKNIPYASMVHIKDFYKRPKDKNPGAGWFTTTYGNYLRGSIIGQGDIDLWTILKTIKNSSYDGFLSIEFEGMEECTVGAKISLDNARRIYDEV